jgi:hypothetical protein
MNNQTAVSKSIDAIVASTKPFTSERLQALSNVRWVLRSEIRKSYLVVDGISMTLTTNKSDATVYDGRDNETAKVSFFKAITGINFTPELL